MQFQKSDVLSLQSKLTMIISIFQPALFENIVNETIQHLHEVVVQHKLGEPEVDNSYNVTIAR